MPTTNSPATFGLVRLQTQLAELEQFGLERPANASLSEYLQFLVDEELVDQQTARRFELLYHHCRFGQHEPDTADLGHVLDALHTAFVKLEGTDEEQKNRLVSRLHKRFGSDGSHGESTILVNDASFPAGTTVATALNPSHPVLTSDSLEDRAGESDDASLGTGITRALPVDEPARAERPKRLLFAGFLAVWTAAVVIVVYLAHEHIDSAFASLLRRNEPELDETAAWIEHVRQGLLATPPEKRPHPPLYRLARLHDRRKEYAESIAAFHQLLAHQPEDESKANVLNALAWELLTAEDQWYRDPVQAMQLAERAVAINPDSPMILDTLAEAYFQTGDPHRAAELERQAIEKLRSATGPESRGRAATLQFMRSQLRKFTGDAEE